MNHYRRSGSDRGIRSVVGVSRSAVSVVCSSVSVRESRFYPGTVAKQTLLWRESGVWSMSRFRWARGRNAGWTRVWLLLLLLVSDWDTLLLFGSNELLISQYFFLHWNGCSGDIWLVNALFSCPDPYWREIRAEGYYNKLSLLFFYCCCYLVPHKSVWIRSC